MSNTDNKVSITNNEFVVAHEISLEAAADFTAEVQEIVYPFNGKIQRMEIPGSVIFKTTISLLEASLLDLQNLACHINDVQAGLEV